MSLMSRICNKGLTSLVSWRLWLLKYVDPLLPTAVLTQTVEFIIKKLLCSARNKIEQTEKIKWFCLPFQFPVTFLVSDQKWAQELPMFPKHIFTFVHKQVWCWFRLYHMFIWCLSEHIFNCTLNFDDSCAAAVEEFKCNSIRAYIK